MLPPMTDGKATATTVPSARVSTFASLRDFPEYRILFLAGFLIFFGVQAQQIARGTLAYELTGSNKGLGGVFLGFGVPMLLLTPVGGVVADRLPKRTVMLIAQTLLVLSAIWIGAALLFDALEYWMLIGASVLQGCGFSVFGPTRVAYTGELVPRHMIGNAVALTQVSLNSTRVLGPAIAGAMIGIRSVGETGVYIATAVIMAVSLIVTFRLPAKPPSRSKPERSIIGEFTDGVRYARGHPLLNMLILTSFVMVMVGWPYIAFLPAASIELFDAGKSGYGLMNAVSAAAALAVTFWIAGRARPNQAWTIQAVAGVAMGVGLLGIAVSPSLGTCLVALLLVGGAASAYQAMNNTIVLTLADLEYHGRVQSLLMLSFSGFGLAALPLGALADAVGLRPTFTGMGIVCLITMAVYIAAQRRHRRGGGDMRLESSPA